MLWLIRGLPGTGKTAYANGLGCLVLDADAWHVRGGEYQYSRSRVGAAREWCFDRARAALRLGLDVAVPDVFPVRKFLLPYLQMAREEGAPVTIVEMSREHGSRHHVSIAALREMKKSWEPIPPEWERTARIIRIGDESAPGREGRTGEGSQVNYYSYIGAGEP